MAANVPGDTMVMQGHVKQLQDSQVEVDFSGRNNSGLHVSGSATLALASE